MKWRRIPVGATLGQSQSASAGVAVRRTRRRCHRNGEAFPTSTLPRTRFLRNVTVREDYTQLTDWAVLLPGWSLSPVARCT